MATDSISPNHHPPLVKWLIPRSERQKFVLQFTLMTILGWVVGGIASLAVERIMLESLLPAISSPPQTFSNLVRFLSNVLFALIFGADQALAIRRYVSGWLWMFATSAGWLITNAVATGWSNYISSIGASLNTTVSPEVGFIFGLLSTISYIISGIWLGFFQWLVLRPYTAKIWWWNFIPAISFLFVSLLVWSRSLVQSVISAPNIQTLLSWSEQAFTAIILGVIPAIALCTVKRKILRKTETSSSSSD